MRRPACARGAGAVVLLLALTGCGSHKADAKAPTSPSTSASSAPSTAATSPSTTAASPAPSTPATSKAWVSLDDQPTGVRFSFPDRVEPQSRPGQNPKIVARLYEDKVDDVALSVT